MSETRCAKVATWARKMPEPDVGTFDACDDHIAEGPGTAPERIGGDLSDVERITLAISDFITDKFGAQEPGKGIAVLVVVRQQGDSKCGMAISGPSAITMEMALCATRAAWDRIDGQNRKRAKADSALSELIEQFERRVSADEPEAPAPAPSTEPAP